MTLSGDVPTGWCAYSWAKKRLCWLLWFSEQLYAYVRGCVEENRYVVFVIARINEYQIGAANKKPHF